MAARRVAGCFSMELRSAFASGISTLCRSYRRRSSSTREVNWSRWSVASTAARYGTTLATTPVRSSSSKRQSSNGRLSHSSISR